MFRKFAQAAAVLGISFALSGKVYVPGAKISGDYEEVAVGFLESHCFDCHDDETSEAGVKSSGLGACRSNQCCGLEISLGTGDHGRNASQKQKKTRCDSST